MAGKGHTSTYKNVSEQGAIGASNAGSLRKF